MLDVKPQLSVVVPAYNEAERIGLTLNELILKDPSLFDRPCEVLVVMDGCTDDTPKIVKEIIGANPCAAALVFPSRLGKGGAIMEALKHTQGDVIAFVDADGSIPASELRRLIKMADDYDLVIGSRYSSDSRLPKKRSLKRTLLSRAFNVVAKLMFWNLHPIKDTQCGVKVFSRRLIDAIKNDFLITGFAFDVNFIYSALSCGFKVKEVGISWMERDGSKMSGSFGKHSVVMAFSLLRLRLYYSRARRVLYSRRFSWLFALFYMWSKS
ncbi:MAG: glycosyltransferase [Candidatus Bathyarchaeota archaeon]|nr:glycosyltransferase [Candidatus Bathyarchaeota archaeon]